MIVIHNAQNEQLLKAETTDMINDKSFLLTSYWICSYKQLLNITFVTDSTFL